MSRPVSGYSSALTALVESGVRFVVVGVGGINFYAREPSGAFATLDLAVLLEPTAANLGAALGALSDLGYTLDAGGEPFVDERSEAVLRRVVQQRATLSAHHEVAGQLDLMLSISGASFPELAGDATSFRVGSVEVPVGRLERLLDSKQASGRAKDLEFLRAFRARSGENVGE